MFFLKTYFRYIGINALIFCFLLVVVVFESCGIESKIVEKESDSQQNVILLIGDGMGLSQISTAFFFGDRQPNFQRFPVVGLIKTSSGTDLITDSAAGATAFSTGVKTYNGAIGMNIDTLVQPNIVEMLSKLGVKTGIIATSSITHATPASFYAHVESRERQEKIAEWLPESELSYFAGGGEKFFNKREDGRDYIKMLKESGFIINTGKYEFNEKLTIDNKYGFLLATDGMPRISDGRGNFLSNSTSQALNYLSRYEEGFFLMVEGSQIDWGGHNNDSDYIIEEVNDFDKAIGCALDFAIEEGNTTVIVVADHETGGYTLSSSTKADLKGKIINDYNRLQPSFSTKGHSATLIPVFAFGPSELDFNGIYENTDIFKKVINIFNRD